MYEPFRSGNRQMAPYNTTATVQAAQADRDAIFGPNGAIAKFASDALGSLVTRRGTGSTPRAGRLGVNLRPNCGRLCHGGRAMARHAVDTVLELMPGPAEGLEYSITIDGQTRAIATRRRSG